MKKLLQILLALLMLNSSTHAQVSAVGNGTVIPYRFVGWDGTGPGGAKDLDIKNDWNRPIKLFTNGLNRVRLNEALTATVNGVTKPFDGYFGISPLGFFNTNTPWSMLHLDGSNNTGFPGGGWRQWMNTGTFMRENSDGMYVGLMEVGTNRSDAIINWSDDENSPAGPDKLRFIFTGANTGNGAGQTNPRDGYALNGYEFMRMTTQGPKNSLNFSAGHIGIGPLFTDANFPKSRLHMNAEDSLTTYLQITLQNRSGSLITDGLKFGILGQHPGLVTDPILLPALRDGNALMYNQEQRHIIFSTGNATPTNINASRERVRITHIGAPTNLVDYPYYGIHNPASLPLSRTRVAISHDPSRPITRPLSLLHLGYNTTNDTLNNTYDGWRNWMDVGMFVSRPFDHLYFGHKVEGFIDRADAIIGWGNEDSPGLTGPDALRFIFTKTFDSTAQEPAANLNDGLECARIYPGRDTTSINLFPNYTTWGRFGVGDFSVNGLNGGPTHKLDVDGNGRFRLLPDSLYLADSTVRKIVMVDTNGVLRWQYGGLWGNYCGDPTNTLLNDYEIDMGDQNIFFRRGGTMFIGDVFCGQTQNARVFVRNSFFPTYSKPIAFQVTSSHGVGSNIAGYFQSNINGGNFNVGIYSEALPVNPTNPGNNPTTGNYAAYFKGDVFISGISYINGFFNFSDQNLKTDIDSVQNATDIINQLNPRTFKYDTIAHPEMNFSSRTQYGFIAQEVENVIPELVGSHMSTAVLDSNGNVVNTPQEYKTLNYLPLLAILTKGIQEQNTKIDSLENVTTNQDSINTALQDQINSLYSMITSCCNNSSLPQNNSIQNPNNQNQSLDITLTDNIPSIVLDQNVPNPFAEQTTITYKLTEGVQKAQMLFYNIEGKLIQSVPLANAAGQGQINVFANDLSTGVYTYTLVVDGEIKGTKRMVKE